MKFKSFVCVLEVGFFCDLPVCVRSRALLIDGKHSTTKSCKVKWQNMIHIASSSRCTQT